MTDYMRWLRSLVGNSAVLQCGASVLLVNSEGEILLQKRRDNDCWGYHGGGVELSEVVEEAAKRELYEETGLVAHALTLFGVFSGPDLDYTYPNGDMVSNIDIVFLCNEYSGTLRVQSDEVVELRFFAPNMLPKNISPPQIKALEQYINRNCD